MSITTTLEIVRPPVILVHGLWGDKSAWNNFYPLVRGVGQFDYRFYADRVDYSAVINPHTSDPLFPAGAWFAPRENSLGYEHNAPLELQKIKNALDKFKAGNNLNRPGVPLAAVQVDVVAHSLGGVITRTLPLLTADLAFLNDKNYNQGSIHKLITLAAPHAGSPLATKLLDVTNNGCTRIRLAKWGAYYFNSVT